MIYFTALVVYTFAAFGLAYTISDAVITRAIREWLWRVLISHEAFVKAKEKGEEPPVPFLLQLIECPACLGFWIGLLVGLGFGLYVPGNTPPGGVAIVLAFYTTGTNFMLARYTGLIA